MKKTTQEIFEMLQSASNNILIERCYRHYKGGVYKVLGFVILTDNGELGVRYKRITGPDYDWGREEDIEYVRPYSEWFEQVEDDVFRFVKVKRVEVWSDEVMKNAE